MTHGKQNLDREFWRARAERPFALTFIGYAGVRRHGPIVYPFAVRRNLIGSVQAACYRCSYSWHVMMAPEASR